MRFISLFAGIGGLDLGLERAGMECVAQVEIDDFCQKILTKHWPDVPKFKDVRDVGKHNLPAADLIAGGFPCQPHSLAGKRKASIDNRDLWPEFARIVREYEPEWVMGENVPGLLSSDAGRFFGGVLRDLAASGYDVEWQSLPAAAFGAPHIRERVFIIAHNNKIRGGGEHKPWINQSSANYYNNGAEGIVADSSRKPFILEQFTRKENSEFTWSCTNRNASNPDVKRLSIGKGNQAKKGPRPTTCRSDWRPTQSPICRRNDGVPNRVDRLRALGNAVVPQVAEFIGRCIMEA
jgi:DNA (cytosine-5)-methyltransferase 1